MKSRVEGTVLVVGGGAFGSLAARRALERGAEVLVIDSHPDCEAAGLVGPERSGTSEGLTLLVSDWRACFREAFEGNRPSWTVPAVPGHMLGMVALDELKGRHGKVGFPPYGELGPLDPHVVCRDPSVGLLVTSFMHESVCRTDCGQPELCPVTGEGRPVPMHSLIGTFLERRTDRYDVLKSVDLGGVGAIARADLESFFEDLEGVGEGEVYGVATSCRCHAAVNLLSTP